MSDQNTWNDAQQDSTAPAKKKGMSGCMIAAFIFGGMCLLGILVCAGVGFWAYKNVKIQQTENPAEVNTIASKILNIQVPEGFAPKNAMEMDIIMLTMQIAAFDRQDGKGEMMMGCMKMRMGDPKQQNSNSDQSREKFEEKMRDNLEIKKTETHEVIVNGQKVSVVIGEGVERTSGKTMHTLTTDFDQSNGKTFLLLKMDDEIWNEDSMLEMLEGAKPLSETGS